MVHHVVWNADGLCDGSSVIYVVKRAATSLDRLRHALLTGKAALIPELHREADHVMPLGAEHGRDRRRIDSARHGNGNGLGTHSIQMRMCGVSLQSTAGFKVSRF